MLMTDNSQDLINKINNRKSEIRGKLGHRVGQQMRIVPDVLFILDEIQEEARRIDDLIDKLEIPPAPEEEEND
jgi:ribosome-binding factor A